MKQEKKKKNRRTLKNRIRRIISAVILFIFVLLVLTQSFFGYFAIKFLAIFVEDITSHTSASAIDGNLLALIQGPDDFGSPLYRNIERKLKESLGPQWNDGLVRFTVVKAVNGQLWSVFDNEGRVFNPYPISQKSLDRLSNPNHWGPVNEVVNTFTITAYAPIYAHDKLVGIFAVRARPELIRGVFAVFVGSIAIFAFIGYLFSLIITRVMTMRITKPLETLTERIRMIARAEGDLSQRISFPKTYKEVEELSVATNMVMESTERFVELLEDKQHRLEDKNRELGAQAEELEAQTEELIALNESLEDALRKLQDAQVQLVQSEKMASLGQLTAGIAHEINTPLGAINSNTNIIEMVIEFLRSDLDLEHNEKARALVERVEKANDTNKLACDRIMQIVRHLKNFARLDESDFKEACIHDGIDSVLILSHNILKHRVQVHKEYGEIPMVRCFPNLLNQVMMNIVVNAAQAMPDRGDIWIKTWAEGEKVLIEIKDNGVGIPKENLKRIFDPGFTTKGVGVGTGLGLSICYKIMEKHNGRISVDSEVGKGTTFTIEIPINNTYEQMQVDGGTM